MSMSSRASSFGGRGVFCFTEFTFWGHGYRGKVMEKDIYMSFGFKKRRCDARNFWGTYKGR